MNKGLDQSIGSPGSGQHLLRWVPVLLALALVFWIYTFRADYFPKPDYDELGLTQLLVASCNPSVESENLWSGVRVSENKFPYYPLILHGQVRFWLYRIFDIRPAGLEGRTLSAIFMIASVTFLSLIAARGNPVYCLVCFLVLGLQPAFIHVARSFRPEAEILLSGSLSCALLLYSLRGRRVTCHIAGGVGGILAVVAAGSHPLGIIFFAAASGTLFAGYIQHRFKCLLGVPFIIGCLAAGLFGILPILLNLEKTLQFTEFMNDVNSVVQPLRLSLMKGQFPGLYEFFPLPFASALAFYQESSILGYPAGWLSLLISVGFWLFMVLGFVGLIYVVMRFAKQQEAILLTALIFAVTFSVTLFYPVHASNYAVYASMALLFPLMLLFGKLQNPRRRYLKMGIFCLFGVYGLVLFSGALNYLFRDRPAISSGEAQRYRLHHAIAADFPYRVASVDFTSWSAASSSMKSIFQQIAKKPDEADSAGAVIFNPETLNTFVEFNARIKNFAKAPQQLENLRDMLSKRTLEALAFDVRSDRYPMLYVYSAGGEARSDEGIKIYTVKDSKLKRYVIKEYSEVGDIPKGPILVMMLKKRLSDGQMEFGSVQDFVPQFAFFEKNERNIACKFIAEKTDGETINVYLCLPDESLERKESNGG